MANAAIDLSELVLIGAGVLGWVLLFRTLFAAREGITWTFQALLFGVMAFLVVKGVLVRMHRAPQEATLGGCVGATIAVARLPKRSRYVRASVRRRVIARDLKGEPYDSRTHHIDHIWPHARGGSNTADNLRVIPKKDNLKKGARKPGLKDWL